MYKHSDIWTRLKKPLMGRGKDVWRRFTGPNVRDLRSVVGDEARYNAELVPKDFMEWAKKETAKRWSQATGDKVSYGAKGLMRKTKGGIEKKYGDAFHPKVQKKVTITKEIGDQGAEKITRRPTKIIENEDILRTSRGKTQINEEGRFLNEAKQLAQDRAEQLASAEKSTWNTRAKFGIGSGVGLMGIGAWRHTKSPDSGAASYFETVEKSKLDK